MGNRCIRRHWERTVVRRLYVFIFAGLPKGQGDDKPGTGRAAVMPMKGVRLSGGKDGGNGFSKTVKKIGLYK